MKFSTAFIYFVAVAGAIAQGKRAPLPSLIIIYGTNQSAPITIVHTSEDSLREDFVKQQSVVTNLNLTCMSAKSLTSTKGKDVVLVVLHDATSYGPSVVSGKYGAEQKLQTMRVEELTVGIGNTQLVQVNGLILTADRFAQRFKFIPEKK